MKKWLTITALLLTSSQTLAIPACEGIDLKELKEKFMTEVQNEHDYKAFKPFKWRICARMLGRSFYIEEKDKADKLKEEKEEAAKDQEDTSKKDENKEGEKKEGENKDDVNKEDGNEEDKKEPEKSEFSPIEIEIANRYLHKVYPNYPNLTS